MTHQLDKQDIMDILALISGAQIRFADAERAVELRRKLEAMLEAADAAVEHTDN